MDLLAHRPDGDAELGADAGEPIELPGPGSAAFTTFDCRSEFVDAVPEPHRVTARGAAGSPSGPAWLYRYFDSCTAVYAA